MCGIAGWISTKDAPTDHAVLTRMTEALAHRGPDGHGAYHATTRDGHHRIALGHCRLAIIDPAGGIQPMLSTDGQIALIFNGEIYNFQALRDDLRAQGFIFTTQSDTEVLINAWRAWGVDCLRRLRGMFAFALWDAGREMLFMARDRFGKKPLFLHQSADTILFASEIKALLAHPGVTARQDLAAVLDYLTYRYVPAPATMFEGITKLMPGTYALWHKNRLTQAPYAVPPDCEASAPMDAAARADPVQAFADKLDESVRLRMIADVPFGAFLSGGLDSSAIVALMTRHSDQPINTYSIGFDEVGFDESAYAKTVAQKFGTHHFETRLTAEDIIRTLPTAIRFQDAPLAEPTDVALLVLSRHAAQSVKMVLSGEGADEILAGYPKHQIEPWVDVYQAVIPQSLHDHVLRPLIDALPAGFYRQRLLAHILSLREVDKRLPRWFGALDHCERDALLAIDLPPRTVGPFAFTTDRTVSSLRRCLAFDQLSWLPDNLLERGDRMTMAASVESRMPFMDHELAMLVSTLPDAIRLQGGQQKWILRQAMRDILPAAILNRRKVGFRVPVSRWLQAGLKDYVHDHLLGLSSRTRTLYQRPVLEKILHQHQSGQLNHEKLIWMLLSFELFQKEYGLGF